MRGSWWHELRQHPVYLRESGCWGTPNPFYDRLSRLSPFVVIGALFIGICAGFSNPTSLAGDGAYAAFWCLLCLPAIFLNALTLFGSVMAPALTAPTVSMEMNRGTWELLRVTPHTTQTILLAKLFGSLARLRIWRLLLVLSLLQGALTSMAASLAGGSSGLAIVTLGLSVISRPWLELFFAAFAGIYISTLIRSETVALAAAYGAVLAFKLINSSVVWVATLGVLRQEDKLLLAGGAGPVLTYLAAILGLWFGFNRQAVQLSYG